VVLGGPRGRRRPPPPRRHGDIILRFGETFVGGIDDLHRLLTEERVGHAVPLLVLRGRDQVTLALRPAER
jgi:S1-C subfamily serine protease